METVGMRAVEEAPADGEFARVPVAAVTGAYGERWVGAGGNIETSQEGVAGVAGREAF